MNLKILNICSCAISVESSNYLGEFIVNQTCLRELSLIGIEMPGVIGVQLFKNFTQQNCNIQKLNLMGCVFSSEMIKYLGKAIRYQTHLTELYINETNLENGIGVGLFENISTYYFNIQKLDLANCKFSIEMPSYLGMFFFNQCQLMEVDLSYTNLESSTGVEFFRKNVVQYKK